MTNTLLERQNKSELKDFYDRWVIKCNSYEDSLSDLFDKYFSLFVIYNRLYNEITAIFENNGTLDILREDGSIDKKPKRVRDNQAATVCVAKYLSENENTVISTLYDEIAAFTEILQKGNFNIVLYNGIPQKERDKNLLKNLENSNNYLNLLGLLGILYNLRCNLFHGQKQFSEIQKMVMIPAVTALEKINKTLIQKMTDTID